MPEDDPPLGSCGVQIWLTYDEFAAFMDCDPASARHAAASIPLDRRRSRDGRTRVKLSPPLIDAFLDLVMRRRLEQEVAACAADLRETHARMRSHAAIAPRRPASATG